MIKRLSVDAFFSILTVITLLFAQAFAPALAQAPGSPSKAEVPETANIRLGLLGIADEVAVHVADKLGYFRDEGLSINVNVFTGGAAVLPALIADKLDFAHTNIVSLLLARAQGYDLTIVSSITATRPTAPDASQLIVKKDSPLRSVKDLEGKRVATNTVNNVIWVAVRALMDKNGADSKKVIFQEIPFPQMLDMLLNDRVDAIASVEPFATIASGTGNTRVLAYYYADLEPNMELSEIVARESWVKKHPITTRKFARAFRRGIEYLNSNPAQKIQALIEHRKMNPALADKVLLNVLTTRSNPKAIRVWEDWMLKYGLLKQRVGVEDMVYKTALE